MISVTSVVDVETGTLSAGLAARPGPALSSIAVWQAARQK